MPPNKDNPEENVPLSAQEDVTKDETKIKSGVITSQPEKSREVSQDEQGPSKSEDVFDSVVGMTLLCNALEQCWLGACACCIACCDCGFCMECVNGTCEGFVECLNGCGECCIHCCQ